MFVTKEDILRKARERQEKTKRGIRRSKDIDLIEEKKLVYDHLTGRYRIDISHRVRRLSG